jgi:serine/threonine protein phosphatase 1
MRLSPMHLPSDIAGPLTVIGDVHGNARALRSLVGRLAARPDFRDRWLVFAGDFADRGPDPRGVLDLVLALRAGHPKVAAVCGNHDHALAAALGLFPTPAACDWAGRYARCYDAGPTFAGYAVAAGDLPGLRRAMPAAHRAFLAALPWAAFHPQYLVVHAGLRPDVPYAEQVAALREPDRTDGRPPWLCDRAAARGPVPADCPVTVVSGHVRVAAVTFRDRRVLVDTTGGTDGRLSAVLLPEGEVVTSAVPCRGVRTRIEGPSTSTRA